MTKPASRNVRARVAPSRAVDWHHALLPTSEHAASGRAYHRMRDPAVMLAAERLAEIGELLAVANRRAKVRRIGVDGNPVTRPSCVSVNGDGAGPAKETA